MNSANRCVLSTCTIVLMQVFDRFYSKKQQQHSITQYYPKRSASRVRYAMTNNLRFAATNWATSFNNTHTLQMTKKCFGFMYSIHKVLRYIR